MSPEFKTLLLKLIYFLDSEKISVTVEEGKFKIMNARGEFRLSEFADPESLYKLIDKNK